MRTSISLAMVLTVAAGLFVAAAVEAAGQDRQVVGSRAGDGELRRAAHRLRLCESDLRQLRAALEEATDLAIHSDEGLEFALVLSEFWLQIHRPKAPTAMQRLVKARLLAAEAFEPGKVFRESEANPARSCNCPRSPIFFG